MILMYYESHIKMTNANSEALQNNIMVQANFMTRIIFCFHKFKDNATKSVIFISNECLFSTSFDKTKK